MSVIRRPPFVSLFAVAVVLALSAAHRLTAQLPGRTHDPDSLVWRSMSPGIEQALVDGTPGAAGQFAIAIRFKAGSVIQPHWHPGETRVIVIRGDVWVGFADEPDTAHTKTIGAGGFAVVPPEAHHFEGGKTDAMIIITGIGPLKTTFVKPGPPHP